VVHPEKAQSCFPVWKRRLRAASSNASSGFRRVLRDSCERNGLFLTSPSFLTLEVDSLIIAPPERKTIGAAGEHAECRHDFDRCQRFVGACFRILPAHVSRPDVVIGDGLVGGAGDRGGFISNSHTDPTEVPLTVDEELQAKVAVGLASPQTAATGPSRTAVERGHDIETAQKFFSRPMGMPKNMAWAWELPNQPLPVGAET
jgi:hypothetical protein